MGKIYNNYTYQYITDQKLRQLLDQYSPAAAKIPLSAILDQALANGVSQFVSLTDTPSTYTGQATKAVAVNAGETGLEFVTFPAGTTTFLGLTDTPAAYTAAGGQLVRVNAGATALEFLAFGAADQYLKMNAGGTALEWGAGGGALPVHFGNMWYVDYSAAAGGDGSPWAPFNLITDANTAASQGDAVIVASNGGQAVSAVPLTFDEGKYYKIEPQFAASLIIINSIGGGPIFVEAAYLNLFAAADAPLCTMTDGSTLIFMNSYISVNNPGPLRPIGFHIPSPLTGSTSIQFFNSLVLADMFGGSPTPNVNLLYCEDTLGTFNVCGRYAFVHPVGPSNVKIGMLTGDQPVIKLDGGMAYIQDATIANMSASNYAIELNGGASMTGTYAYIDGHVANFSSGFAVGVNYEGDWAYLGKNAWLSTAGTFALGTLSMNPGTQVTASGAFSDQAMSIAAGGAVLALGEGDYRYVTGDPNSIGPAAGAIDGKTGTFVCDWATNSHYMFDGTTWQVAT